MTDNRHISNSKVLLYLPEASNVADRLKNLLEIHIPEADIENLLSIQRLSQRLRQLNDDLDIAILMATTQIELMDIFSIRHLLRELRIILLIPDQNEKTVALAHRLRPRLLMHIDDDLSIIPTVLAKMLKAKWKG